MAAKHLRGSSPFLAASSTSIKNPRAFNSCNEVELFSFFFFLLITKAAELASIVVQSLYNPRCAASNSHDNKSCCSRIRSGSMGGGKKKKRKMCLHAYWSRFAVFDVTTQRFTSFVTILRAWNYFVRQISVSHAICTRLPGCLCVLRI